MEAIVFLFVNAIKMYQFKAKESQIKQYSLCLDNISKNLTFDHMEKVKPKRFLKVFFFLIMILLTQSGWAF